MSLKTVDVQSAMRRLAEIRIEEAMREGKFDHLAGAGKPIDLEPIPADENARMMWWCLRLLKQNDIVPDEIRLRKHIDLLEAELTHAQTRQAVTMHVRSINDLVRAINTLGNNTRSTPLAPGDVDAELRARGLAF